MGISKNKKSKKKNQQPRIEGNWEKGKAPEIAMANPQPPPQTSFQEYPDAGALTITGVNSGVLCGSAPGK